MLLGDRLFILITIGMGILAGGLFVNSHPGYAGVTIVLYLLVSALYAEYRSASNYQPSAARDQ